MTIRDAWTIWIRELDDAGLWAGDGPSDFADPDDRAAWHEALSETPELADAARAAALDLTPADLPAFDAELARYVTPCVEALAVRITELDDDGLWNDAGPTAHAGPRTLTAWLDILTGAPELAVAAERVAFSTED